MGPNRGCLVVLDRACRHARRGTTGVVVLVHPLRPVARGIYLAAGVVDPPPGGARAGTRRDTRAVTETDACDGTGEAPEQRAQFPSLADPRAHGRLSARGRLGVP